MRLSVIPGDRGYRAFKALPRRVRPHVTVDGVEVGQVLTADDRTGYVLANALDTSGLAMTNARRTAVLRKQILGRVVIELRRDSR